jgi:hypothetical protein
MIKRRMMHPLSNFLNKLNQLKLKLNLNTSQDFTKKNK